MSIRSNGNDISYNITHATEVVEATSQRTVTPFAHFLSDYAVSTTATASSAMHFPSIDGASQSRRPGQLDISLANPVTALKELLPPATSYSAAMKIGLTARMDVPASSADPTLPLADEGISSQIYGDSFLPLSALPVHVPEAEKENLPLASKMAPGVLGRRDELLANFFKLEEQKQKGRADKFIITISLKGSDDQFQLIKNKNHIKQLFLEFKGLLEEEGTFKGKQILFDEGQELYVINSSLDICSFYRHEIPPTGDNKGTCLELTKVGSYDFCDKDNPEVIKVLNMLIGSKTEATFDRCGQYFFSRQDGQLVDPKENPHITYKTGILKSVRDLESGLMVNIESGTGVFVTSSDLIAILPQMLAKILKTPFGEIFSPFIRLKVESKLKGLKFRLKENFGNVDHQYTIKEVCEKGSSDGKFNGHTLSFPRMNYIMSKCEKLFSIEAVMLVEGIIPITKLGEKLRGEVTKKAIIQPAARYAIIKESAKTFNRLNGTQMTMCTDMTTVSARIIDTPALVQDGKAVTVISDPAAGNRVGEFPIHKLHRTSHLTHWIVVQVTRSYDSQINPFVKEFIRKLGTSMTIHGMELDQPMGFYHFRYENISFKNRAQNVIRFRTFLRNLEETTGLHAFLFTYPDDSNIYTDIKMVANDVGILCQAVNFDASRLNDEKRMSRMTSNSYLKNMVYKMNTKLGGASTAPNMEILPQFLKDNTVMFMGIDVTHHQNQERNSTNSLIGMVASFDNEFLSYSQSLRNQESPKCEVIQRKFGILKETTIKFLNDFNIKNGFFPTAIVVYRDGVSEGEFNKVRNEEVEQMKEAIASQVETRNITLSYIVVQKRHKTRLFQSKVDARGVHTVSNPIPGTVVDQGIVSNILNEFYLVSANALIGTAKGSKFINIYDENRLDNDQNQSIAFLLSHLCGRCNKSISIPAPVKWAHHLAEFGSNIYNSKKRAGINTDNVQVHPNLQHSIFYA